MTKTENIGLNLIDATDPLTITPLNENFKKIDQFGGNIPSGTIWMWYGNVESVPDGWQICDGTNGTPNLQGRFPLGVSNSYSKGDIGGAVTVSLAKYNLPRLTLQAYFLTDGNDGLCIHKVVAKSNLSIGNHTLNGRHFVITGTPVTDMSTTYAHTDIDTGGYSDTGSGHNNMPPYVALYFIMKL